MQSLPMQKIAVYELQLLQTPGHSLSSLATTIPSRHIFHSPMSAQSYQHLTRLKFQEIMSAGWSANANLKAFAYLLLFVVYSRDETEGYLEQIKSLLYCETTNLKSIKNAPLAAYGNLQLKKIIVEFFYSLQYAEYQRKIDLKLSKYPIILDIFVLFFRQILQKTNIRNSQNYLLKIKTKEAFKILIEYFDLNCKTVEQIYIFYENRLFISESPKGEVLLGSYLQSQMLKSGVKRQNTIEALGLDSENDDEDDNNSIHMDQEDQQQNNSEANRSLNLKGIVGESLCFESIEACETPTPSFHVPQDDEFLKHHKDRFGSMMQNPPVRQEVLLNKMKKSQQLRGMFKAFDGVSPKSIGLSMQLRHNTIAENMLLMKESLQSQKELAALSPVTMDSPAGLALNMVNPRQMAFGSINQAKNTNQFHQTQAKSFPPPPPQNPQESVKVMKKSKSEHGDISSETKIHITKDCSEPSPKELSEGLNSHCRCWQKKHRKNKLVSHLYHLNISSIQNGLISQIGNGIVHGNNLIAYGFKRGKVKTQGTIDEQQHRFGRDKEASKQREREKQRQKALFIGNGVTENKNSQSNQQSKIRSPLPLQPNKAFFKRLHSIPQPVPVLQATAIQKYMHRQPSPNNTSIRNPSPISKDRQSSPFGGTHSIKSINGASTKVTFTYNNPIKMKMSVQMGDSQRYLQNRFQRK